MVNLPTGAKADISHVGEAQIINDEIVRDVMFVPDFKAQSIVSVKND